MPEGRVSRRSATFALSSAALALPPAALIAALWLELEEPRGSGARILAVVTLALAPALARPGWLRLAVLVVALLAAVNVAFPASALGTRSTAGEDEFFGGLFESAADGILAFYDVSVPFSPNGHPLMHGVVLLAIFGFGSAVSLLVAARRPVAAGLALVAGAGWPATLGSGGSDLWRGTLLLAAFLLLLASLRVGSRRAGAHGLLAGGAVLACAAAISAAPAVAKDALLDWKHWDLSSRRESAVSVSYVWDANYRGIAFPERKTVVLRIKASPRSLYWRATTLDSFNGYGWVESRTPVAAPVPKRGRYDLSDDPLLPAAARGAARVEQEVTVVGLRDEHLVGASVPVAYEAPGISTIFSAGGVAYTLGPLQRGDRYRVWSYAPTVTPRALARSRPDYPAALLQGESLSVVPALALPVFGTPARHQAVLARFERLSYDERVAPYAGVYAKAREVVGEASSPYAAVVALESWFQSGEFTYDERPPAGSNAPLADFVLRTRRGYCQHFAGAMALMLRYLGIPARVAAGFTSGSYDTDDGEWTVTDRNAHTWVEVWFRGFGWLPFDPTPARGNLSGSYTAASRSFDLRGALAALGRGGAGTDALRNRLDALQRDTPLDLRSLAGGGGSRRADDLPRLLLALIVGLGVLVVGAKATLRRSRYLTRDPRRIARAAHRELCDLLRDQGIEVPPQTTTAELAPLVATQLGVGIEHLARAVGAGRFGPPSTAAAGALQARRELASVRRQLRNRLGRARRLRGALSLRSLGLGA